MDKDEEVDMERHEALESILAPLGFKSVKPGVFAQVGHQWIHFDLRKVDPRPEVVLPTVMDMLWDKAKEIGVRQAQQAFRDALGLK